MGRSKSEKTFLFPRPKYRVIDGSRYWTPLAYIRFSQYRDMMALAANPPRTPRRGHPVRILRSGMNSPLWYISLIFGLIPVLGFLAVMAGALTHQRQRNKFFTMSNSSLINDLYMAGMRFRDIASVFYFLRFKNTATQMFLRIEIAPLIVSLHLHVGAYLLVKTVGEHTPDIMGMIFLCISFIAVSRMLTHLFYWAYILQQQYQFLELHRELTKATHDISSRIVGAVEQGVQQLAKGCFAFVGIYLFFAIIAVVVSDFSSLILKNLEEFLGVATLLSSLIVSRCGRVIAGTKMLEFLKEQRRCFSSGDEMLRKFVEKHQHQ